MNFLTVIKNKELGYVANRVRGGFVMWLYSRDNASQPWRRYFKTPANRPLHESEIESNLNLCKRKGMTIKRLGVS